MKNMQEKLTNSSVPMAAESQRELTVASNQIELLTNLQRKCAAKHAAFDPRSSSIMFKHSAGEEAWFCKHWHCFLSFVWNCFKPRGRT